MQIAYATPQEAEAAQSILIEVSKWLLEHDMGLWDPNQFSNEWRDHHQARGEFVVAQQNGRVVATMLLMLEDAEIWDDYPSGEAVFVHKLAVARGSTGQGITQQMLEFAVAEAQRLERSHVRLDTALREPLVQLYESAGFVRLDKRIRTINNFVVWRLERRVVPVPAQP